MKKFLFALVLVLVTASFAVAREKTVTVKGEVASVDTSANTLTVKEKDKEVTLNVTDKTRVMFGKERKGLADIKAGDKITAWTVLKEGKTIAKSIRVSTSQAAPAAKAEQERK